MKSSLASGTKIIAYQLSLLGEAPKPFRNWRRAYWTLRFMGCPMPLNDDEIRQNKLLRPDSNFEAHNEAVR